MIKLLKLNRDVSYFVQIDLEHMQKAQLQLLYYDMLLLQSTKMPPIWTDYGMNEKSYQVCTLCKAQANPDE